jgi:sarcosine oxidase, subunit gamma
MSELRQHHPVQGRRHTTADGSLVLEALPDEARFSLRVGADHLLAFAGAFGCDMVTDIGAAASRGGRRSLTLGPDEWFLLVPEDDRDAIAAAFAALGPNVPHSLVDAGHRSVAIRIAGAGARDALNSGCPLDLSAIPVGGCTRSVFHKAEVILLRLDADDFRLEVVRSFADYVWSMLERAVDEVGSGV